MSAIPALPSSSDPSSHAASNKAASTLDLPGREAPAENHAVERRISFEQLRPFPHPFWRPHLAAQWLFELAFGILSLFALLAALAAIPIANFIALGYLLEAEGQVGRTGKLRNALPLLPLAPKLGGIAAGVFFWCWVVHLVADAASDARLIAPEGTTARNWRIGLFVLSAMVFVHLLLAVARGGRLSLFFWPTPLNAIWLWKRIKLGGYWRDSGEAICDFITALRLRSHFWLGLRGFILAFVWLFIPTAMLAALKDTSKPGQVIVTILGGILLIAVLAWVPFLQARFAVENRARAMFDVSAIRECYRRVPISMFLSVVVLYGLSLPLYLFKVAALPSDTYWLLTPIFIASIYPAKILIGCAYFRATHKERRAPFVIHLPLRLLLVPLLGIYVFALFFTPTIGAAGRAVLFQHHSILLPWPY